MLKFEDFASHLYCIISCVKWVIVSVVMNCHCWGSEFKSFNPELRSMRFWWNNYVFFIWSIYFETVIDCIQTLICCLMSHYKSNFKIKIYFIVNRQYKQKSSGDGNWIFWKLIMKGSNNPNQLSQVHYQHTMLCCIF